MTESERPDLATAEGREWLNTPEGRVWLDTQQGEDSWIFTPPGWEWLNSPAGERWQREQHEAQWDVYFAGRTPEPPPFAMTPESAPQVGTRVRFTEDVETVDGGTRFAAGELAVIEAAKFLPSYGIVSVDLRTLDGRRLTTTIASTFDRA